MFWSTAKIIKNMPVGKYIDLTVLLLLYCISLVERFFVLLLFYYYYFFHKATLKVY